MQNNASSPQASQPAPQSAPQSRAGRWVVVIIFLFAIVAVGTMRIYLERHSAPFRPLRRALATEFKNSAPKVEGGQTKMHKNTPVILRIVMRVEFNPNTDSDQAMQFARRVYDFTRANQDLSQYEIVELHLYYLDPESKIAERQFDLDAATGEVKKS